MTEPLRPILNALIYVPLSNLFLLLFHLCHLHLAEGSLRIPELNFMRVVSGAVFCFCGCAPIV